MLRLCGYWALSILCMLSTNLLWRRLRERHPRGSIKNERLGRGVRGLWHTAFGCDRAWHSWETHSSRGHLHRTYARSSQSTFPPGQGRSPKALFTSEEMLTVSITTAANILSWESYSPLGKWPWWVAHTSAGRPHTHVHMGTNWTIMMINKLKEGVKLGERWGRKL